MRAAFQREAFSLEKLVAPVRRWKTESHD